MTYDEIIEAVSKEVQLSKKIVHKAYKAFWLYIHESIKNLPLKEELSKEDFDNLRTCFNIPSLGKLNCTYDRLLGMRKRFEYIKKLWEKK